MAGIMKFFLVLGIIVCWVAANDNEITNYDDEGQQHHEQSSTINVLVLVPWPDNREYAGWDVGLDLLPGSRIAAREINDRHDLLQGYNITIVEAGHDACGLTVHSLGLTNMVWTAIRSPGIKAAGVLGLYCSTITAELAKVAGKPGVDLIQLSASYSPLFKDRLGEFPHLYRFVPSADIYTDILIRITNQYGWNKLAIVTNTENIFYYGISKSLIDALKEQENEEKEVVYEGSLVKRVGSFRSQVISDILQSRARIIIISAPSHQIADLLCEAYKKNMKYPNYLWIIMDWILDSLLTDLTYCDSKDQLLSALEGSVLFYLYYIPSNASQVTTGTHNTQNTSERDRLNDSYYNKYENFVKNYWEELKRVESDYKDIIEAGNVSIHGNIEYASLLYNQVYGLSLALNSSISKLKDINVTLDKYGYGQPEATSIIEDNLKRVVFEGFTSRIRFNDQNEVTMPINVFQVINGTETLIHRIDNVSDIKEIPLILDETVDDEVPVEYVTISTALTLVLSTCTLVLFVLVTLVLVLILKYRNVRRVRASSVKVSMLMFVACYGFVMADIIIILLCSIELSLYLYSTLCNLSYFFFYNASIMLFLAQILKQQRVNMIFSNSSLKVHGWWYSNWMLVLKTVVVCLIGDIVLVTIISIKLERQYFFEDYKLTNGIIVLFKYPYCYASEDNALFYGLYLCIGVMLMLNIYHATSAKKIMKEDFRVTKFVNLYTIIVFITLCITVPFKEVFFNDNKYVLYVNVVVFFSIFISASLAQLILFLPLILHALNVRKKILSNHF